MVVEEAEVRRAIRAGARTVDDVGAACEAGTGCGSCRGPIGVLLEEEASRRTRRGAEAADALAQLGLFGGSPRKP